MDALIITPEKTLFSGKIKLIQLPGTKGSFEIMENHAPLISSLEKGKIKVITDNEQTLYFDIEEGFVEVKDNNVNVLVE
jgi:F-type H+-transporting ATPase subunit epsilon